MHMCETPEIPNYCEINVATKPLHIPEIMKGQ